MRWHSIAASALALVLVAGCGGEASEDDAALASTGSAIRAELGGEAPGSLLDARTIPTLDRRLTSQTSVAGRIVYRSTSGIDGSSTTVSGIVLQPEGDPPPGGWPVVAFGHGSVGVLPECGPTLSPNLVGASPLLVGLVKLGYVVVMTDYQGLGDTDEHHPYLDATTEGYNLIDSVRAARILLAGTVSDRWLAFGGSQGGQAAWAANELAAEYGTGLSLVGSASLVPAADIAGLADKAAAQTLTVDQRPLLQWLLYALSQEDPDFDLDDYRRGVVEDEWEALTACAASLAETRTAAAEKITPADLAPADAAATDRLRDLLARRGVPGRPAAAPMLVIYGGQDTLIDAAWTRAAIAAACGRGSQVQEVLQPDSGHADVDAAVVFEWISARFAGGPAVDTCARG